MARRNLLVLLCLGISCIATGQENNKDRDPSSIAIIRAVLATGGGQVLHNINDFTIAGTLTSEDAATASGSFTWVIAGNKQRYENAAPNDGHSLVVLGASRPSTQERGVTRRLSGPAATNMFCPALPMTELVAAITGQNYAVGSPDFIESNGKKLAKIKIWRTDRRWMKSATARDWFFDTAANVPVRVEYDVPANNDAAVSLRTAFDFAGFGLESGVLIPHEWTTFIDGQKVSTSHITSIRFNTNPDPSIFEGKQDGQ